MNAKYAKWVGLMAAVALPLFSGFSQSANTAPPASALSPSASEVVKLAQSGTSDDVILGFIQNSQSPYNLTADDVVYLKDVGLSSPVITAMLNHDKSAPGQPYVYNQQLYPPTGGTPPPAPDQPVGPPPTDLPPQPPAPEPAPLPASVPVSTTAPPEVNYFYNNLSPYGSWVDLEGYGWCWQPSVVVVNHGWRPYCDSGHWVYTDAGWFWASDYSWGWAPFHYGRWQLHPRCGWVWFPDTTWAPAWVVWRNGGDNCGWAPLPRGAVFDARAGFRFNGVAVAAGFDFGLGVDLFTFVGFHDFASHDLARARFSHNDSERVFHQTTIINNYTVNNNHIVVNHGIPVERVSAATHTQFHAVAIHDVPPGSGKPITRGGAGAAVYRHEIGPPQHVTAPVAQKVNNSNPVIRHGPALPPNTGHITVTQPTYSPNRTVPQNQSTAPPSHNQSAPTYSTGTHQPANQPATTYHTEQPSHTATTTTATPPPSSTHYTAPNYTAPKQSVPLQTATPPAQPNNHVYYPKGYYQASSLHMLPPESTASAPGHATSSPPPASQPVGTSHGQTYQGQSHGQSSAPPSGQSTGRSSGPLPAQPNQGPK